MQDVECGELIAALDLPASSRQRLACRGRNQPPDKNGEPDRKLPRCRPLSPLHAIIADEPHLKTDFSDPRPEPHNRRGRTLSEPRTQIGGMIEKARS
jgi:hypothetical protein